MSNHEWVHEHLGAYLAGGLTPAERSDIERHSADCAECARTLADSRKLEQMMDDLFAANRPDAALEDRAIAKLRKSRIRRASILRFIAAAAAVLVLGIVGAAVQAIAHADGPFMQASGGAVSSNRLVRLPMALHDSTKSKSEERRETFSAVDGDPAAVEFNGYVSDEKRAIDGAVSKGAISGLTSAGTLTPDFHPPSLGIIGGKPGLPIESRAGGKEGQNVHGRTGANKQGEYTFGLSLGDEWSDNGKVQEKLKDSALGWGKLPELATPAPNTPPVIVNGPLGDPRKNAGIRGFKDLDGLASSSPLGRTDAALVKPQKSDPAFFNPAENTKTEPPPVAFPGQDKSKTPPEKKPSDGPPGISEKAPVGGDKPMPDAGRKIIRTGTLEFEIEKFDDAVDKVNALIGAIAAKGAFVATVNSEKLPNGKVMGSVVVRMAPQLLDKFISDLRKGLAKGTLISQRVGSQDVTKHYTDVKSELRAARAVEERLIEIIKTKKGEIKDLIAAEAELGKWRTKIEKMEGEMRYYDNQIALSTLTITLIEKEILAPFALVVTDHVKMRIEVDEVAKAHEAALKALKAIKGRVTKAEVKQHKAGQFEGILQAQVPPEKKEAFRAALAKLGIVTEHEDTQRQQAIGGQGRPQTAEERVEDVVFDVAFNNIANVEPRQTVELGIATTDVATQFAKLKEEITTRKGQITDGNLNEQDKVNINATLDFSVPIEQKAAIEKLLAEAGPALKRTSTQKPPTVFATERKFGYKVRLYSVISIPPRETVTLRLEVKDVDKKVADIKDMVAVGKGRVVDTNITRQENGQVTAVVIVDVKIAVADLLVRQIKESGNLLSQQANRDTSVPENELTTARIHTTLVGVFAGKTPREVVKLKLETTDVDSKAASMKERVRAAKGRVADERAGRQANGQVSAILVFEVPLAALDGLVQQFKEIGKVVTYDTARNTQVPDNDLATAQIAVMLTTETPIVGNDADLGTYIRRSLTFSFQIFAYCILAIITGLSALVPICLVILVGCLLFRWFWPGEKTAPVVQPQKPATVEPEKPNA